MSTKANAVEKPSAPGVGDAAREDIERAGDAMMLLINRALWETLLRQAAAEGISPGQVLDRAMQVYLKEHGAQAAVDYLKLVGGQK